MNSLLDVMASLCLIVVLCVADILDFILGPFVAACICALVYKVVT